MNQPPHLFNQALLRRRLAKADFNGEAGFLLRHLQQDMLERLALIKRDFSAIADLASPLPPLEGLHLTADQLDPLPLQPLRYDLITALGFLQVVDDLPGLLIQAGRALKPDGLLLAAFMGGETLTELRQCLTEAESEIRGGASPRVIPFVDIKAAGGLLQRAGLALPVADSERLTIRYDHVFALIKDLRAMGATNPLMARGKGLNRAIIMRLAEIYAERFADADGRIRVTVDVIWLSGWAPHESQQKPLKPGSAQMRLADALKPSAY